MREAYASGLFVVLLMAALLPAHSTAQSTDLVEPTVQATELSPAEGAAIARDAADAFASQSGAPPLLSSPTSSDYQFAEVSTALTGLADALDNGQTKDAVRQAYDRVIFALAKLAQGNATQNPGPVSTEAPPALTDIQALGRYVGTLQASP